MAGTAGCDRGTGDGLVIGILDQHKHEMLAEMEKRLCDQETKLCANIDVKLDSIMDSVAERVVSRLNSRTSAMLIDGSDGSRPAEPDPKKKMTSAIAAEAPQVKKICVHSRRGTVPLSAWLMAIIVGSMGGRTSLAQHWLTSDVRAKLSGCMDLASSVSGLEAALFAVAPGEKKREKFESSAGILWSQWFRRSILSMLSYARTKVLTGDSPVHVSGIERDEGEEDDYSTPQWLSSLNTPSIAAKIVNQVFDRAEVKSDACATSSGGDEVSTSMKRRKLDKTAPEVCAIKNIRAVLMSWLNYRRTDARAYLYGALLFLVHKISEFETLDLAKQSGYEISLYSYNSMEDSLGQVDGIWDIPVANTVSMEKARSSVTRVVYDETDDENVKALSALECRFPGLSVRLKYKRRVLQSTAVSGSNSTGNDGGIFWNATEDVHLHTVATGFLMELFKVGDSRFVLASSPHSLQAIHTIAIGFRGVLKRFLGQEPTAVEKNALGNVTHMEGKAGGLVGLMMGLKESGNGKEKTKREKIYESKFYMSSKAYEAEVKRLSEEEERRAGENGEAMSAGQGRVMERLGGLGVE